MADLRHASHKRSAVAVAVALFLLLPILAGTTPPAKGDLGDTADLSLTMAAPAKATVGEHFSYTLTVRNAGPHRADLVTVVDELPPGVDRVSVTTTRGDCGTYVGPVSQRTIFCNIGDAFESGATAIITIQVKPLGPGAAINVATLQSTTADPNPANNRATATTVVEGDVPQPPVADLKIVTTSARPDPVFTGGELTYVLHVTNAGPAVAEGTPRSSLEIRDVLPAGVIMKSAAIETTTGGYSYCGSFAQDGRGTISCFINEGLSPTQDATVTLVVVPTRPGALTNIASIYSGTQDANYTDNQTMITTSAEGPVGADLMIAKAADSDTVAVGSSIRYTLTATNRGPFATDASVSDLLPVGVRFNSASASQGTCQAGQTNQSVTCDLGSMPPSSVATITITVVAESAGTITNYATIRSQWTPDSDYANNTASVTTTVTDPQPPAGSSADLSLTNEDRPDPVAVSRDLTYTLRAHNAGPDTATAVTITDLLPAGVVYRSSSGGCSFDPTPREVVCPVGDLAAGGASAAVTITVVPTQEGTVTNPAQVDSAVADPAAGNNQATATTTIRPYAQAPSGDSLMGTWGRHHPITSPPSLGTAAMAAFGAQGQSVVLFGGQMFTGLGDPNNGRLSNATWTWDGTRWTERTLPADQQTEDNTPSARVRPAMAFDGVNVVLFGGYGDYLSGNGKELDDTWTWDGTRWTQHHFASKPAPGVGVMAFDGTNVVLFDTAGDTWVWDGLAQSWTKKAPSISPSKRHGAVMAYDGANIVLFGGNGRTENPPPLDYYNEDKNDTWTWDGKTWTDRSQLSALRPDARSYGVMAYDEKSGRVLLFGGGSPLKPTGTWTWDGSTGTWTKQDPPVSPAAHTDLGGLAYDSVSQKTLLFGGRVVATWVWDGTAPANDATPPAASIDDIRASEGDSPKGERMTFTVSLSASRPAPAAADFSTVAGTATAGSDYAAVSGTLQFEPGDLSRTITVMSRGDTVYEIDEGFTLNLSAPKYLTLADSTGSARIIDDDLCGDDPDGPAPGHVLYPSGWSLVALPQDTEVTADAPLYSWFNLGAGGKYSSQPATESVEAGRGYWAWFNCPRFVPLTAGTDSSNSQLDEYSLSMVGNPSGTSAATVYGHDFAFRWDQTLNDGAGGYDVSGYKAPQQLAVGEGAWVFSYENTYVSVGTAP